MTFQRSDNSVTCLQFDDRFMFVQPPLCPFPPHSTLTGFDYNSVTGGNDGRVKLWDLRTGQFIRELSKPCEAVWRVTFLVDKCVVLAKRAGKTVMEVGCLSLSLSL